jgi:release factor glutamine methyltransferase
LFPSHARAERASCDFAKNKIMRRLCLAAAAAFTHAAFRLPAAPTVSSALSVATAAFETSCVPEAALSAEYLLTRAAGFGNDRGALSRNGQDVLSIEAKCEFERMCAMRLERTPVQYILGDWDFHDLTLALRQPVLIPRPETEELVEHVLQAHARPEREAEAARTFLDVGCGSGAIGLALLHSLSDSTCVAIDVSAEAVALATENAARCGVAGRYTAQLVAGGIASYGAVDVSNSAIAGECGDTDARRPPRFDVIVSNPPYIPRADMPTLEREVVGYEDERALCGGTDGLDVVRDLLSVAPRLLRPEGPRAIWLEVDPSHPPLIQEWLAREPQASELRMELVRWLSDGYGRPRFCEVRWLGPLS